MKTIFAGLLVVTSTAAVHGNLLVNGSFETPGYADSLGVFVGTGFYREMPAGSTAIDGWAITGPNPAVNWDKITSIQGQEGAYSLFFGPNGNVGGAISQTFSTVPGQVYDVRLAAACGAGAPVLQLSADGQSATFDTVTQLPTTTWQRVSWQFTADDAQATLSISKVSNGPTPSFGFELDAVSVEVAQPVPAPAGLVAWWRGEGDAQDAVGSNHGTLANVTYAGGKVGQAFSFSGAAGQRVSVEPSTDLNLESLPGASFEGWFRSAPGGDAVIVAKHSCGFANGWFFTTSQGGYIGDHHVGGNGVGAVNLNDGKLHHFAVVKDGTSYREYVDGTLTGSDSGPATGTTNPESLQLGGHTAGTCHDSAQLSGLIDEISLYHRALSAAEITAIFEAGAAGKTLSPPAVQPESLLVGNIGDNTIHRFSVTGEDLGVFARTGLSNPHGLTFDRSGNLYVVNLNAHTVRKFAPDGADLGDFASTGPNQPLGVAVDRRGNVYVGYSPGNRIVKFGPDGSDQGTFAQTGLKDPAALAFDAAGNLYVANYGDNTVHKFGPDGADLGVFANAGLHQPTGLAFDRGGNLYVGSSADNAIRKYGPDGSDLGVFVTAGLNFPVGVAFDSAGNLYVGNGNGNTVRRFSPTGADLGVFASSGVNVPRYMAIGGGPVPPEITAQPQSRTNLTGTTATFSVAVTGTNPLTYRWRKGSVDLSDGGRISGATSATLTISELQSTDAGDYTVVVSNTAGSEGSAPATMTVNEPQPVPPPPGMVAWWRAENDARDAFGSHDGEVRNGAGFTAGKAGEAFLFDGQDDYFEVPDHADLRLPNEVTIEFWAKRNRLDELDLVLEKGGDWVTSVGGEANYGVGLHTINGRMFYFFSKGGWRGVDGVNDLLWHHYAVVAVNGQANPSFYIDGTPRPTQHSGGTAAIDLFPSTKPLHLGAQVFPGWNYFSKLGLDEVALYNRALSAAEVAAIFEAGAAGKTLTPPAFSVQPQSRTNLASTTATFSVAVTGTNPLTYRWRKGGEDLTDGGRISGATTATLTIADLELTDAGDYTVVVTNAADSVTSDIATLTVARTMVIADAAADFSGVQGQANWRYGVYGTPGQPASYGEPMVFSDQRGWFSPGQSFNVPSLGGGTGGHPGDTSSVVRRWLSELNGKIYVTGEYQSIPQFGGGITTVRVWIDGVAQFAANTTTTLAQYSIGPFVVTTGSIVDFEIDPFNGFIADSTRFTATITGETFNPPTITTQPQGRLLAAGTDSSLSVSATGEEPLAYQWQFNDVNLPGETGASLALTGIRTNQAGTYRVVVSDAGGSVTSGNAAVTVVTLEPASLTVPAGADARFTATAYGEPPASYRWQFNGGALGGVLPGETSALLIRANAQPSHSGTYRVTVKDAAGRAVALLARLQVDRPETPANPVAVTGWNRDFVLEAAGTPQPGNFGGGDWFEAGWSGHVDGLPQSRRFTSAANPNVTFALQPYAGNDALFFAFRQTNVLTLVGPVRLAALHLLAVSAGGNDQGTVQLEFTDGTRSAPLTFGAPDWWITRPDAVERHIAIDGLGRLFGGRYDGAEPFGLFEADLDLAALGLDRKAIRNLSFTKPVLGTGTETAVFAVSGTPAAPLPERALRITGASATPGLTVQLPVELGAVGDENTVAFSLRFDPAVLTYQSVANSGALPAGAQVVVNGNEAAAGRVGVLLALPQGQTFAAGGRELVRVGFQVAAGVSDSTATAVSFGDQPVTREVVSAGAEILPATYADTAVTITVAFESDVSPRPGGDRRLSAADWTLVGRFAAGLTAIPADAEFQRIDCAPRTTRGDGRVTAVDWTQAGRYVAGLDPAQTAGGPIGPVAGALVARAGVQPQTPATERQLRLLSASASAGSVAVVEVELQAHGDENTLGFSVTFDPAVLNYQSANRGADLGPDALLVLNDQNVAEGRLGVLLALPSGQSFAAGTRRLLELRFNVLATVSAGSTPLAFGDAPIEREIVSPDVDVLPGDFLGAALDIQAKLEFIPGSARLVDERFEATARTTRGARLVLESSTDLNTWTSLQTIQADQETIALTHESPPPAGPHFYRLRTE